mgnify:CR=1 FL=1|tara:strand:- start:1176 stop:1460 length:285 start_codon:yes stop_codon:yes gene_type:complete
MIRYICTLENTDETVTVDHLDELDETRGDWFIYKEHSCKGCGEFKENDTEERTDWYGIYTGHYCEDCYENNYPYKKERYATIEYDGYGERLDDY